MRKKKGENQFATLRANGNGPTRIHIARCQMSYCPQNTLLSSADWESARALTREFYSSLSCNETKNER